MLQQATCVARACELVLSKRWLRVCYKHASYIAEGKLCLLKDAVQGMETQLSVSDFIFTKAAPHSRYEAQCLLQAHTALHMA